MKINNVSSYLNIPKINKTNFFIKPKSLNYDSISFSGAYYNPTAEKKNVKEAVSLGYEIYSKMEEGASKTDIIQLITAQNPDITILPIERLTDITVDPTNYGAFFQYHFGDNYEVEDPKLYLDLKKSNAKNPLTNMLFAMETAHEYTHLRQLKNGDNQNFFNKISPNDGVYGGLVTALGDFLFSPYDSKMQADYVSAAFDFNDSLALMQTGKIIPREKNVSKRQMLDKNHKTESDFKQHVTSEFTNNFVALLKTLLENPNYSEPKLYNKLIDISKKEENINKLYSDLKEYCKFKALEENEAYTTESQVAKKILKTNKMLNIDIFPIYYHMIYEAL